MSPDAPSSICDDQNFLISRTESRGRRRFIFIFSLPIIFVLALIAFNFLFSSVFMVDNYHYDSIPSAPQIQFMIVSIALSSIFSALFGYIAYLIYKKSLFILIPSFLLIAIFWSASIAISISLASRTVQPYRETHITPVRYRVFGPREPDPIPELINTTKDILELSKFISFFLLPYSIFALIYVKKRRNPSSP